MIKEWTGWIDFAFDPLTALAVPFSGPSDDYRWDRLRRRVNIFLDRLRISELLSPEQVDHVEEMREWATEERAKLGVESAE